MYTECRECTWDGVVEEEAEHHGDEHAGGEQHCQDLPHHR